MEDPAPRPIGLAPTARAPVKVPAAEAGKAVPATLEGPRIATGPTRAAGAADDDRVAALLEATVRGTACQVALVATGLLHLGAIQRSVSGGANEEPQAPPEKNEASGFRPVLLAKIVV